MSVLWKDKQLKIFSNVLIAVLIEIYQKCLIMKFDCLVSLYEWMFVCLTWLPLEEDYNSFCIKQKTNMNDILIVYVGLCSSWQVSSCQREKDRELSLISSLLYLRGHVMKVMRTSRSVKALIFLTLILTTFFSF